MSNALLTTKLYFPPPRPSLVPRPRLIERLQVGLQGSLTLLSAPAGAGKTTLLSQWRLGHGSKVPTAWLSLDSADNDLTRFLQYLSVALDNLQPGLAEEVRPLLQSPEAPDPEAILTPLINSLSTLEGEVVLVLDDLHLIYSPAIHTALTFLLEHLPPHLHLVVLSRADPPLPLARLRARGQLVEIRLADLRFSIEECAKFLNQIMGLGLSGEQVAALEQRTEGWVAGLQLAALSIQGREDMGGFVSAFTGSDHYVVDYLVEEVLGCQPESLRQFLLKTSILDRLNGPLCDALTEDKNGADVLTALDHANLFIVPLDNEQRWFRYHHLFADLLRNRLLQSHLELVPQLHVAASVWYEANGFQYEAISHALQAKDYERAARLFSHDCINAIYSHGLGILNGWLQAFPTSFLHTNPFLCITKAHLLYMADHRDEIDPYISSAEKSLASMLMAGRTTKEDEDYQALSADIYSFKSLNARIKNDLAAALGNAQKAVQVAPDNSHSRVLALTVLCSAHEFTGDIHQAVEACSEAIACALAVDYPPMVISDSQELASLLRAQGKLRQSARVLREAMEYAQAHGQARMDYSSLLHTALADVLYEWNDLQEMETEVATGMRLCRQSGKSVFVAQGLLTEAKLRYAQGDLTQALKCLAERDRDYPSFQASSAMLRQRWQAGQGDLSGSIEWVSQVDLNVEEKISQRRLIHLTQAARMLYTMDSCDEAHKVLEKIIPTARTTGQIGILIEMLALRSVVWAKQKNDSRALDCLKEALSLAEAEGYVRVFLEHGKPLHRLLRLFQEQRGALVYVTRLLTAFEEPRLRKPTPVMPTGGLVEPLSRREMDILKLLAQGCPNKRIAETLVIAPGTVHKHLQNIYAKLEVHNRTEAIVRARQLGLL